MDEFIFLFTTRGLKIGDLVRIRYESSWASCSCYITSLEQEGFNFQNVGRYRNSGYHSIPSSERIIDIIKEEDYAARCLALVCI